MQAPQADQTQRLIIDWVQSARRGSQRAYADLYHRFSPLVHSILLGRCRHAHAEELTQECFVLAFERLDQLKEPEKFGPWIATIARRITVSEPRFSPGAMAHESCTPHSAAAVTAPEQYLDVEIVLQALMALPEAYRETLILRLVEGLSGPEIAALTGLTHDSVRVNLHRGMEKLRQKLSITNADRQTSLAEQATRQASLAEQATRHTNKEPNHDE
jgi:RNA polymerase sigma-70 factor, ECF subfamily